MRAEIAKKSVRLDQMQRLLIGHPEGLTVREMADILKASARTIQRDLLDLQGEPYYLPLIQEHWRWKIAPEANPSLPPVRFTLNEAAAIYLAARLLVRYSDEHNPYIVQALTKLTGVLPDAIAGHVHRISRSLSTKPDAPTFTQVFAVVTLGWATRRKVRIWHQSSGSQNVHEYVVAPYFIDVSGAGYATYLVGHATYFDQVHTFKMERISRAELTEEEFELPADFDGPALLESAWGVMFGEQQTEVALRFAPGVTRRVKESVWHPTQVVEDCEDGGCVLRVRVAHTLEIQHWVLQWGAGCEVLEPEELRREVAGELRRAVERYESANE